MREFYRQREPQLVTTPVALNPLIQQVLDLTRVRWTNMPQEAGGTIQLKTEWEPQLPMILGVESEIRDALTNLILNAVDAMQNTGTLTIRTKLVESPPSMASEKRISRSAHIEVVDTGAGMDEDTRRRCLEPFFTTKGERGTGLGLAMVYGTVRRHGAVIEIESELGKGTLIRLIFPVPDVIPAPVSAPTSMRPAESLRLLIVDDDPLLIKSLRDTLEGEGHTVIFADGGQAGIDAFSKALERGDGFEAVITDLGMPYVDGRKVAAAVKAISPHTPVILLTGWGQRMVAEGEIPPHVDQVLSKPPKLRELNEALALATRKPPR
jgi:CheY-like chemotaxis protein